MSRRDKIFFIVLVTLTSTLISILICTVYNKVWTEKYIRKHYGEEIIYTRKNSELSLELLNNLYYNDSIREYGDKNVDEQHKRN